MTTRYLLVDTVASAYIQNAPEVSVGEKDLVVKGFESYLVEQWACERRSNCVVCSYTGNTANSVTATVLYLPSDKSKWSPFLLDFMELMSRNHLLTKDTPLGTMFIANLSSFPSNKILIPLETSFTQGIISFIINENLKRLGCSGRLAVSLGSPSDTTKSNFYDMFHVPSDVPLVFAIRELATLVQISLFYCGMLDPVYVDGFLCDHTIKASYKWWEKFGSTTTALYPPHAPLGRSSGLSPKIVAAIIGFVMGCNYRFSLLGLKSPKDCFSVHSFLQCIHTFQKNERLDKTMRLNTATVHRLHDLTAKQVATGPDLISSLKTTVKENLRGKIQESGNKFELSDIKDLAAHAKGARPKYLWKAVGSRFNPMLPGVGGDSQDPATGIPVYSLADDGTEPRSLIRSPRQKGNASKLLMRKPYQLPRQTAELDPEYAQTRPSSNRNSTILLDGTSDSPALDSQDTEASDSDTGKRPEKQPPAKLQVPDTFFLTKDDTWTLSRQSHPELRRVQSSSNIESIVFKWSFTASIARVYRDYSKAISLRQELEHHLDSNKQRFDQLRETLASRGADFTNENRYSDTIKYRISQSTRKEQAVKQQILNLEAIADKLDFQWVFLMHQIEEVEKSVESFGNKVDSTTARWKLVQDRRENGRLGLWLSQVYSQILGYWNKLSAEQLSSKATSERT